jgi:hypothetical protein
MREGCRLEKATGHRQNTAKKPAQPAETLSAAKKVVSEKSWQALHSGWKQYTAAA